MRDFTKLLKNKFKSKKYFKKHSQQRLGYLPVAGGGSGTLERDPSVDRRRCSTASSTGPLGPNGHFDNGHASDVPPSPSLSPQRLGKTQK